MARELQNPTTIVIIGSPTAPVFCISDYMVVNADMREPTKLHEDSAPDFTQTVSALTTECANAIKATEGI